MQPESIPDGIKFSDRQSDINYHEILHGESKGVILVITGLKATGKTRLAKHIISLLSPGEKEPQPISLNPLACKPAFYRILKKNPDPILWFDEVRPIIRYNSFVPIDCPKLLHRPNGMIILSGEEIPLSVEIEAESLRINLA